MAKIEFKGKILRMEYADGTFCYDYIKIPVLGREHCDMNAFRNHPKYGAYANSNIFGSILQRLKKDIFGNGHLKLNEIPINVSVDTSDFLATVSFEV